MSYKYTNKHNVSLALAVFLMYDDYDHDDSPNSISATTLMKPIRQLVLIQQNQELLKTIDIADLVASRMGSAIHTGCEQAWTSRANVEKALRVLGVGEDAINSVKINPESVNEGDVPVYVEQRTEKAVKEFRITGKFDLVLSGTLNDYKSTSVWGYIYDSNANNYTIQGSIYKWLNPGKITNEHININYIFTDWSASKARQDPKTYPQHRVLTKPYPIWPVEKTDKWVTNKLDTFRKLLNTPQEDLPECTDNELWASQSLYKYYAKPDATRATKNFNTMDEALAHQGASGNKGVVKMVPGEVKACRYCSVVNICTQAKRMIDAGRLNL